MYTIDKNILAEAEKLSDGDVPIVIVRNQETLRIIIWAIP